MTRPLSAPILALVLAGLPVAADAAPEAAAPSVSATGKTMPPAGPRAGAGPVKAAPVKASTTADLQKAQRDAETRNKAWDTRMHKTMGSICKGC